MPSSEGECAAAVEMWILEHACKRRLIKVIDEIVKKRKDDSSFFMSKSFDHNSVHLFVQMQLLAHELVALKSNLCTVPQKSPNFDEDILCKTVKMLEKMFSENHFLPLKLFTNLIARLKLLHLIVKIMKGEDSDEVLKIMSTFFPRANSVLKSNIQEQFKIKNIKMVEKMMVAFSYCRKYVLQYTFMNEAMKEQYLNNTLPRDLADFANVAHAYVDEAQRHMAEKLPPSPLEQIVQGASDDLRFSEDPQIQILIKNLTPDINETSLLHLLNELDSSVISAKPDDSISSEGETKSEDSEKEISLTPRKFSKKTKRLSITSEDETMSDEFFKQVDCNAVTTPQKTSEKSKRRSVGEIKSDDFPRRKAATTPQKLPEKTKCHKSDEEVSPKKLSPATKKSVQKLPESSTVVLPIYETQDAQNVEMENVQDSDDDFHEEGHPRGRSNTVTTPQKSSEKSKRRIKKSDEEVSPKKLSPASKKSVQKLPESSTVVLPICETQDTQNESEDKLCEPVITPATKEKKSFRIALRASPSLLADLSERISGPKSKRKKIYDSDDETSTNDKMNKTIGSDVSRPEQTETTSRKERVSTTLETWPHEIVKLEIKTCDINVHYKKQIFQDGKDYRLYC